MAVDAEVGAIIGGCVAGAAILIAIIAVIIYLICGKRRRKKEREQKKFRQLTPHTSPTHSQPSTLGHGPPGDPRLPKVGSNGLWLGTPGIYAGTPSPAYFYGRPGSHKPHHLMQPAVMQRASSETRLPSQRGHGLKRYHVPARRSASLQRAPGGPAMYGSSGGSQPRIYHSQQLAGLTPVYEVMDPRNGSVYDVYQIGGGSKTKLLQEGGKSSDRHSKGGKRLERSQSDVIVDPSSRRPHRSKHSHDDHRSSKTSSITRERAQVHENRDREPEARKLGFENPAFNESAEKMIQQDVNVAVAASATDSMKLLAKNKTDDQKTVVPSSGSSSTQGSESKPSPASTPTPEPPPKMSSLHYTCDGDIYAVPDKEEARRRSKADNPILARMQDMVIEHSDTAQSLQITDPVTDITETAEPLLMTPRDGDSSGGASLIQNPIYQEVEEVRRESEGLGNSESVRTSAADGTSQIVAAARSAVDDLDSGAKGVSDAAENSHDVVVSDIAAATAVTSLRDAGASGVSEDQLDTEVVKRNLDMQWSIDTDGATDEQSRAGKHISVTAEAFEFLDTYLSDEDGGDIHSPPKSPILSERSVMMY